MPEPFINSELLGDVLFGFVYIPPEVVGLQTSQTTVPISEITERSHSWCQKSFSQPLAVWSPLFIHITLICSSFFLNGYHPKCFDWRVFYLCFQFFLTQLILKIRTQFQKMYLFKPRKIREFSLADTHDK